MPLWLLLQDMHVVYCCASTFVVSNCGSQIIKPSSHDRFNPTHVFFWKCGQYITLRLEFPAFYLDKCCRTDRRSTWRLVRKSPNPILSLWSHMAIVIPRKIFTPGSSHQIHNKNHWADLMTTKTQTYILGAFEQFQLFQTEVDCFFFNGFLVKYLKFVCV